MKRGRFFSAISMLLLVSFMGAGCTKKMDDATASASKSVRLTVWAVIDDSEAYGQIMNEFRAAHPNVSIDFVRMRLEEYEDELLNALAEDRGPDIFMIHNTWVGKYEPKIISMPPSTKLAYRRTIGTVKKETVYQLEDEKMISLKQYKTNFPEAVIKDTVRRVNISMEPSKENFQERILAVPMSLDTLGMYVNKDLLNAAGVATIPETWNDFQKIVPRLVKQDAQGELIQAAAALGTGTNVERSTDILSVLMMQNGAVMSLDNGTPSFAMVPSALAEQRAEPPAFQALSFYTDFANPAKEVYTWNSKQPNSLDAFTQGKVAFFFGYSYHLPVIKARAPKLNLGIAQLPQIEGNPTDVNYANYWLWTVSKRSKNADIAWNFLNYMIKPEQAKKYLDNAKRPAAEKSLLSNQLEDEEIGVFASQVLTSKSWYRGKDVETAEEALNMMIESTLAGTEELPKAVRNAQSKVEQTYK